MTVRTPELLELDRRLDAAHAESAALADELSGVRAEVERLREENKALRTAAGHPFRLHDPVRRLP